jgi:hypothetical protein
MKSESVHISAPCFSSADRQAVSAINIYSMIRNKSEPKKRERPGDTAVLGDDDDDEDGMDWDAAVRLVDDELR